MRRSVITKGLCAVLAAGVLVWAGAAAADAASLWGGASQ